MNFLIKEVLIQSSKSEDWSDRLTQAYRKACISA